VGRLAGFGPILSAPPPPCFGADLLSSLPLGCCCPHVWAQHSAVEARYPSHAPALLSALLSLCSATTHTDMVLRARSMGIPVHIIHNASVMTAVANCGVNLYNYGQTVSIPFFTETWQPDSFYDKLAYNLKGGMHTLCLLGA
jgi:hypothetical protein